MRTRVLEQIYISYCPSLVLLLHRSEYMQPSKCDKYEARSKRQKVKVAVLSPRSLQDWIERLEP